MDNFDEKLVLKQFLHNQFGVEEFEDFREVLNNSEEGFKPDNTSAFAEKIKNSSLEPKPYILDNLSQYDQNIQEYEEKLNRGRDGNIQLKYFQWLSLLFTEVYLDLYFNNRKKLWLEFSEFVEDKKSEISEEDLYSAAKNNLSKLAYWMATGAGKTLIMHANLWQYQRYGNGELENILLITPNEGLTKQHIEEFEASGINASKFRPENSQNSSIDISVLDIHKLRETSGDKTYSVDIFEGDNLVFVDEGHKGAQGDTWMKNREQVIGDGFSFEYSATFGQALNSINNERIQNRYVQSIIFQYSFNNFHQDGFGKDYDILNLKKGEDNRRDKYLVANLLSFYEQKKYFKENRKELEDFNIEDPLWIFVGQTVNATGRDVSKRKKASDVEKVVRFLARVLREKEQVVKEIEEILTGTDFLDSDGKRLFEDRFTYLKNSNLTPREMYSEILNTIFNAESDSSLNVVRLKNADGEIGLRVGRNEKYFGLVSIGDTKKFLDRIEDSSINVEDQEFKKSLFDNIDSNNSNVNVLIGAKKFVEGWDSYRVSNMGLMRVGKSEGSEIIQIFGRGIRLKGYGNSLKRTSHSEIPENKVPNNIEILERLNVFGVEADYIKEFEDKLEEEGITINYIEKTIPTKPDPEIVDNNLKVPKLKQDTDYGSEVTDKLEAKHQYQPVVDLYSQVDVLRSKESSDHGVDKNLVHKNSDQLKLELVGWNDMFVKLVEYKEREKYSNTVLSKQEIKQVIEGEHFILKCPEERLNGETLREQKENTEEVVEIILRNYLDNFYKTRKSRWEDQKREYLVLQDTDPGLNFDLKFQIPEDNEELREEIEKLKENPELEDGKYVVKFDRSLYQPLFVKKTLQENNELTIPVQALNEGEEKLVNQIKELCEEGLLNRKDVYLLRNPRNRGIGFTTGGFPDFLLWVKKSDGQKLIFIDPHGMTYEPDKLEDVDKIKLNKRLKEIQNRLEDNVEMSSHVISTTEKEDLNMDNVSKEKLDELNFYFKDKNTLKTILEKEGVINL